MIINDANKDVVIYLWGRTVRLEVGLVEPKKEIINPPLILLK